MISDLEARIEELSAIHIGTPQQQIQSQAQEIKRLEQIIDNKDAELVEVYQINQLERRIRELEKSLETDAPSSQTATIEVRRDSHNSNQPPSLDLPWIKPKRTRSLRQRSGLQVGGQPSHPGVTLHAVAEPHHIIIHSINECSSCHRSLDSIEPTRFFRRQVFEIENGRVEVVEHRTPLIVYPGCGTVSRGKFPLAVSAPVQYGTSVLSRAFARTDSLTHLATHINLGRSAFDAIGILNQYKGILVRDGWFSYKQFEQCEHSLCNAHLLRNLVYIGEAEPIHKDWTDALARLLIEIKEAVEVARSNLQTEMESNVQTVFFDRYDKLIAKAEEAVRGSPSPKAGLTARNLLNRFIRNKTEVLRFMTDFRVPFDNNGAERDLRMLKLQQKIAGCFRTVEGVQAFCRVRSYLSSARKQSRELLGALEHALKGKPIVLLSDYSLEALTMRLITIALITFTFWSTQCAQSAKTVDPQSVSNEELTATSIIDAKKAREFSDNLAKAIIEDRYREIYSKMEKPFRDAIAEKDLPQTLEKLYAVYGKPSEVEYKMTDVGFEMRNDQKRPVHKNWYAVKTSKVEKGTYFLFIDIVPNGDFLTCSSFAIVNFPQGIPSQLK